MLITQSIMFSLRSIVAAGLAAVGLGAAVPATAAEVGGIRFDDGIKLAGKKLELNGLGIRIKAVFEVCAMGLYLRKKDSTPEAVLAGAGPRRVAMVMLRDMTGEDLGQALMAGLNANTDKTEKAKVMNQMVKLGEIFVTVGAVKKGDQIMLDWLPEKGTDSELNGKPLHEPLPDIAFYDAMLKIWLGDKPADAALEPLLPGAEPEPLAQHLN